MPSTAGTGSASPGGPTPTLLARAYGLGPVLAWTPAARGWAGEIFKLVVPRGAYAAKEFVAQRPDAGDLERQHAFATACRAAGVPSPETVPTVDGALLFEHPATGRPWLVQRWVEGSQPDRTDLPTGLWLARQAATIHRLAVPCHPEDKANPFYTRANGGWAQTAQTARRAGAAWARRLDQRVPEFERLTARVNAVPPGAVVTCHRDLKATNTLLKVDLQPESKIRSRRAREPAVAVIRGRPGWTACRGSARAGDRRPPGRRTGSGTGRWSRRRRGRMAGAAGCRARRRRPGCGSGRSPDTPDSRRLR